MLKVMDMINDIVCVGEILSRIYSINLVVKYVEHC